MQLRQTHRWRHLQIPVNYMALTQEFPDIKCIFFHNDHEDKSKNQQTRNGTITKSVGCFVIHIGWWEGPSK